MIPSTSAFDGALGLNSSGGRTISSSDDLFFFLPIRPIAIQIQRTKVREKNEIEATTKQERF
jgi:hypothetical protein